MDRPEDGYTGLIFWDSCLKNDVSNVRSELEIPDFDVFCKVVSAAGSCGLYMECRRNPINPTILDTYDVRGTCLANEEDNASSQQG